jgi:hypothetical protein
MVTDCPALPEVPSPHQPPPPCLRPALDLITRLLTTRPCAAQRGRTTLTVIFARRENARREEDGPAGSRGRGSSGLRCGGGWLPAGAGAQTWWRRRARRAPARQGAAGRLPRSRRVARDPARHQPGTHAVSRNASMCSRFPRPNSAGTGRPGAPEGRALEYVKKVVTASGQHRLSAS